LLKYAGLINTGGEAKDFLAANLVLVNGGQCSQRGKKLYSGDTIKVKNQLFTITR
jgi:ribosome-associated protein